MKNRKSCITRCVLIAFLAYFTSSVATATLIPVSGSFKVFQTDTSQAGIDGLTGSFSIAYDDTLLNATGITELNGLTLNAFSINPNPIGVTLFDTSNVSANLSFFNGNLSVFALGGGDVTSISSVADDFSVYFLNVATTFEVTSSLSVGTSPGTAGLFTRDNQGAITIGGTSFVTPNFQAVPLPGTLVLIGAGMLAFGVRKSILDR